MGIRQRRPLLKQSRALQHKTAQRRSSLLARKKNAGHVALVYGADRPLAIPGDTVIFTAWITNDSAGYLRDVTLIPRSFTNEGMEMLQYTSEPVERDLRISLLAPGQSAMRSFSYVVTDSDHLHGGSLVSAMQVHASCRGQRISDEHDAIVSLCGTRRDWPFPSSHAGRPQKRWKGYEKSMPL
ncbi:hypothetical protein SAMN04487917_106219 [Arthrobacter sp. yr096]|uniref:hypothetical protein n=1 Tax=Arthrobacter sp. yr096 TaxID=1761750 RepID=UPI0008D67D3C|nr:hypothetical protein [Arthrobacter sp. yr096]SEJ50281.1 hypothetical protein SAMN04487917_106219 [Arthrobacter sp. yr096]